MNMMKSQFHHSRNTSTSVPKYKLGFVTSIYNYIMVDDMERVAASDNDVNNINQYILSTLNVD